MAIHFHYPHFDFVKSVRANENNLLIMSTTSSKAGKHPVYLREDIFHCKSILLETEKNTLKKFNSSIFLNSDLIIEVQIQAPEAAHTLLVITLK